MSDLYKDYERESTLSGSATLFAPHAGLRFYLKQNPLKLYVKANLLLLPSINGESKYERTWYDQDGNVTYHDRDKDEMSDSDKEDIHDALDFVFFMPGVGVEYPFSDHFSIGGEFGLRFIFNKMEYKGEDKGYDDYDDITYWKEKWSEMISATVGITYTSITLNYIF